MATDITGTHTKGRWIGQAVPRVEDAALLIGAGSYVDDLERSRVLHVSFVRSPIASGRIRGIDVAAALEDGGAETVLTAADLEDVGGLRARLAWPGFVETEMPLLAGDRVRHAGEPVAMVLASSPYEAEDAAERVVVDYEPTPAVVTMDEAQAAGAPLVHAEAEGNLLMDSAFADDEELDEILASAAVVVETTFTSGRVNALPMEGRACLAEWNAHDERLTLYTSTQLPHMVRTTLADRLDLAEHKIRVVAPDVGGGFGQKGVISREEVLIAAAAYRLRATVKWIEDRQENLVSSFHGHDQRHAVKAGFAEDGRLLGLSTDIECDIGAYSCFPFSCGVETLMAAGEMPGPYRLRHYRARTRGVATNKAPMAPYRGVSRPQLTFAMERLMDMAAGELGMSRADIRLTNLIPADEFPYRSITGVVIDEGSYAESMKLCLDALGFDNWPQRQAQARREGRLLGLGFSCFAERTGYGTATFSARRMAITPGYDSAQISMDPSGGVTIRVGTSGHGQGHRTSLAQIVAEELGVPFEDVRVIEGDTDAAPYGWGTFASRTAVIAGGSSKRAAAGLADKIRRVAAHLLEASPDDMMLVDGRAVVRGSPDAGVDIREVARIAYHAAHRLAPDEVPGLDHQADFDPPGTFSNATHGAIVEVSPETGAVRIEQFVVAEDCGVVINPMIVEGQVRGGVAQGIAAALYEQVVYDDQGQCQTATLMDYLMPTATEIPPIEIMHLETPSQFSETGAKGMGEGGTIGAPAAIANAVADAVAHLGVPIDRIPITPQYLLASLHAADRTAKDER